MIDIAEGLEKRSAENLTVKEIERVDREGAYLSWSAYTE